MKYQGISILLHLTLLLFVFFMRFSGLGESGKGNGQHPGIDRDIMERELPTEVEFVPLTEQQEAEIEIAKNTPIDAEKQCPNLWYGGIGVRIQDNVIMEIFRGYTAHSSGLLVGDRIVSMSDMEILGTPGTNFTMKVQRNGVDIVLNITRTKVCYW